MTVETQLSSATGEHGSPHEIVSLARDVLGGIDCDPCSSAYFNEHVVKAVTFFTEEHPCLCDSGTWLVGGAPIYSRFFINPPPKLVKEFWRFACARWLEGSAVLWLGFNLDQLAYTQREGAMFRGFSRVILPYRLQFLRRPGDVARELAEQTVDGTLTEVRRRRADEKLRRHRAAYPDPDGPPIPGTAPTRNNWLCLLPSAHEQVERFRELARALPAEVF